jgi:pimeloyl-ACP methyl ester carboxylesterase
VAIWLEALDVLGGSALDDAQREQVIADTLRGEEGAKQAWPQHGMTLDISASLRDVKLPVELLIGNRDQVEREPVLRPTILRFLPQATFTVVPEAGHLLPLVAAGAIASACMRMISTL